MKRILSLLLSLLILLPVTALAATDARYRAGDIVTFGSYCTGGSGTSAIEWLVLDVNRDDNTMLIVSRNSLDCQPWNSTANGATWATCSLRSWLNGSFLNTAFNPQEQADIVTALVDNSSAQSWKDYIGGDDTRDKVFLLSYQEVMRYMPTDEARRCAPTAYAAQRGVFRNKDGYVTADGEVFGAWWLRSNGSGMTDIDVMVASGNGTGWTCDYNQYPQSAKTKGVRPAMWVRMDSVWINNGNSSEAFG